MGLGGLPQGAPNLLLTRLDQARRDLEESPQGFALPGHTQSPRPQGFGKMWTEEVPGSWQEGLTRGRKVMRREKCFSVELLDVKPGLWASKRELWRGSQSQRAETFPIQKLPDPQTGSSFRLNQT